MNPLKERLKEIETCVRYILYSYPETRNNDKLLILLYWELVDGIKIPAELHNTLLLKATPPELITRVRRRIQEEGDYLPKQKVHEARHKLEETFKKTLLDF